MNHDRIDITTVKLCAKYWTFALPRPGDWKKIRASPPKLEEPAGRYFIHCIQHWIFRNPQTNPFKTLRLEEVWQETILVDSHGQIYKIRAYPNMRDDWGVYYFTLTPQDSYTPLSLSQIEAVKAVRIMEAEGWECIPSKSPFDCKRIQDAIRTAKEVEVKPDPLAVQGIFEEVGQRPDLKMTTSYGNLQPPMRLEHHEMTHISSLLRHPEIECGDRHIQFWKRPLQIKPVEEVVETKRLLRDDEKRNLCNAYIHAQWGSAEQKKDGISFLRSVLKREVHKNAWPRIDHMTRTMLAHRITKRFEIEFPSAQEKKEHPEPQQVPYRMYY